jgi:malonyl-CoA O-methyltransferase
MINKQIMERHFSQAAAAYDMYACVQKSMAQELMRFMEPAKAAQDVLEIGCGTGFLTQLLTAALPQATILASDISSGMLAAAQARLGGCPQLQFAVKDGEALREQAEYDLVISNAAFQWFVNPKAAFQRIYDSLRPGGRLVFATFGPETFFELHASFQAALSLHHIPGKWQNGPAFLSDRQLLAYSAQAGFSSCCEEREYKEYFPAVRDFLHSVKKVGANNSSGSGKTLVSRRVMADMMKYYTETYAWQGQIPATYQVFYVICKKPALSVG